MFLNCLSVKFELKTQLQYDALFLFLLLVGCNELSSYESLGVNFVAQELEVEVEEEMMIFKSFSSSKSQRGFRLVVRCHLTFLKWKLDIPTNDAKCFNKKKNYLVHYPYSNVIWNV